MFRHYALSSNALTCALQTLRPVELRHGTRPCLNQPCLGWNHLSNTTRLTHVLFSTAANSAASSNSRIRQVAPRKSNEAVALDEKCRPSVCGYLVAAEVRTGTREGVATRKAARWDG